MSLNFDNVESASGEQKESQFKVVTPGVKPLVITGVEPTVAGTGTPGIVVTFESPEDGASFNHQFWLSAGAIPRVQYLVEKFTGAKMTGSIPGEGAELAANAATSLGSKLVGKSKECVVDGERTTKEVNGRVYNNTYPTLRYAGFVEPTGNNAEPIVKDRTASTPAKAATPPVAGGVDFGTDEKDDLPF
jgi:hypothetical protein